MSNILLVPIHLDALVLHQKQVVVEAMADFTRLPYDDGRQDRNASVPYLSEEILSQPFQDRGLHLNAGVHLHWALPDALTKGYMDLGTKADRQSKAQDARMLLDAYSRPSTVTFPPVPNRWLVTRSRSGAVERQWVVESDYLFPPATIEPEQAPDAINYPFPDAPQHPDDPQQPFRYMGRKVTLDDWIESDETGPKPTYLTPLTAVGYGEPNFAAFYPNCHSVFGCYDDELSTYDALSDVAYDLLGWYSASNDDCLSGDSFCQAVKSTRHKMYLEETTDATSFAALADLFRWTVSTTEQEQDFPTRLICYARLTFAVDSQTDLQEEPWFTERSVKVAVGNTGTEALTAYLVHQLGDQITLPNEKAADGAPTNAQGAADGTDTASVQLTPEQNKRSLEDLWEALHLAPQLQGQRLDSGPRFREARHEKGFSAVSAGMLWMIRPAPGGTPDDQAQAQSPSQVTLPPDVAHTLNQLNLWQEQYNRAQQQIEALRKDLYADWCKYQLCLYPPEETPDEYPDIDEMKYFIETHRLAPLQWKLAHVNAVAAERRQLLAQCYRQMAELQLLTPSDILNWKDLHQNVYDGLMEKNVTIVAIVEQLASTLQEALRQNAIPEPAMQASLIAAFNELLLRPNLDQVIEAANGDSQLPSEVQRLNQELVDPSQTHLGYYSLLRRNRLLLEACFPAIRRSIAYILQPTPAPRYWQPNDPVVLIVDPSIEPTPRHGEDGRLHPEGLLTCQLLTWGELAPEEPVLSPATIEAAAKVLREKLDDLDRERKGKESIGFTDWQKDPWHPFLLEWAVELLPAKRDRNGDADPAGYDPDFIANTFQLNEHDVDLTLQPGRGAVAKGANFYTGRSILTPHANLQLQERIAAFLAKQLNRYYAAKEIIPDEGVKPYDYLLAYEDAVIAWFKAQGKPAIAFLLEKICNYSKLTTKPLAQALGGFNEALLMHKQTFQLPIDDPIGFADYQTFAQTVGEGVQQQNQTIPQPLNDFNPIRCGVMRINELRLVDTFGRTQKLRFEQLYTPAVMTTPAAPHLVALRPRLAQPARLNFRWLAANQPANSDVDEVESNSHPATSPVCGWLLANYWDQSLMVYDQAGEALGSINQLGHWSHAPGGPLVQPAYIANPHLNKLVNYLLQQAQTPNEDRNFLADLLTVMASAQENIDPENYAQHEALALLLGRPLAVVRATINLEVRGRPATDQSWRALRLAMTQAAQSSGLAAGLGINATPFDFTHVRFPIRLGEYRQLNDGLVGYWKEVATSAPDYAYAGNCFYVNDSPAATLSTAAAQSAWGSQVAGAALTRAVRRGATPAATPVIKKQHFLARQGADEATWQQLIADGTLTPRQLHPNIHDYADQPDLWQSIADPPQRVTMLVDPRGGVHATTGILPVKTIQIPPDHYSEALRHMEVTFLTAPVLTGRETINLPLPSEPGAAWSWMAKENGVWIDAETIDPVSPSATFAEGQRLREGWLKLRRAPIA